MCVVWITYSCPLEYNGSFGELILNQDMDIWLPAYWNVITHPNNNSISLANFLSKMGAWKHKWPSSTFLENFTLSYNKHYHTIHIQPTYILYGIRDLDQCWFRWWPGAWQHQAISWINANLPSMRSSGIHCSVMFTSVLLVSIQILCLKFTLLKLVNKLLKNMSINWHAKHISM